MASLIQQADSALTKQITENYGLDLATARGRMDLVEEYVAKASHWHDVQPKLWQWVVDFPRRIALRVEWLRNIAPRQVLGAKMRGLARRGALRLSAKSEGDPYRNPPPQYALADSQSQTTPQIRFRIASE